MIFLPPYLLPELGCVVVVVLRCAAYPPLCRAVSNVPIVRGGDWCGHLTSTLYGVRGTAAMNSSRPIVESYIFVCLAMEARIYTAL